MLAQQAKTYSNKTKRKTTKIRKKINEKKLKDLMLISQIFSLKSSYKQTLQDIIYNTMMSHCKRAVLGKAVSLIGLHLRMYKRLIMLNRRRTQLRIRKRQAALRNTFMQALMEVQSQYLEWMPVLLAPVDNQQAFTKKEFE